MSFVILGIVFALISLVVYYLRGKVTLETEKAALDSSKAASEAKIKVLQQESLKNEYQLRDDEKVDLGHDGDGPVFYPGRLHPDKDNLN